jgi:hypothetical protein
MRHQIRLCSTKMIQNERLSRTVSIYSPLGAAFLAAGRDIVLVRYGYVPVCNMSSWGVVSTNGALLQFVVVECRRYGELKVKAWPIRRVSTCASSMLRRSCVQVQRPRRWSSIFSHLVSYGQSLLQCADGNAVAIAPCISSISSRTRSIACRHDLDALGKVNNEPSYICTESPKMQRQNADLGRLHGVEGHGGAAPSILDVQ